MKIIELIKEQPNFYSLGSISEEEIILAEERLGINFADDYKSILLQFGAITFSGHELTGIFKSKRLNVVDVTLSERDINPNTKDLYVVEIANVDSIIIWQGTDGAVYRTKNASKPVKIGTSLAEYLQIK